MTFNLATAKPNRAPISRVKVSAADEKRIRDGMAYLTFKHPFFAHILYAEMRIEYTHDIPLMATDSYCIFINVEGVKKENWDIAEIAFVLAHEAAHYFLSHLVIEMGYRKAKRVKCPTSELEYFHELCNIAQDYVINAMLVEGKVGKMPKVGLHDKAICEKGLESWQTVYENIMPKGNGGKGQGGFRIVDLSNLPQGFDIHLDPSTVAIDKTESGQAAQSVAAAAAVQEASGKGELPAGIKQLLGEILEPKVKWQDKLKSTCMRKGGDPMYNWRALDRRLQARPDPLFFANQDSAGAGCVVIAGDTSGSVYSRFDEFFAEMNGIVQDLNPAEVIVLWGDAELTRVDHIEEPEDLVELHKTINDEGGPGGGGGTSFVPFFEYIEENGIQPDMLVILTDTYGTFPKHEPDFPTIWASIVPNPRVPFGEVVYIGDE